jgi:hypothetical protein
MNFGVTLAAVELGEEASDVELLPSLLSCTSYGKSLESDRLENSWKARTPRHHHHSHLFLKMIGKDSER